MQNKVNHLVECRKPAPLVSVPSFTPELKCGLLQRRNLKGAVYLDTFTYLLKSMKNFNLSLVILGGSYLFLLSGCQKSIFNLFPKELRPFQEKAFDSQQWKDGDYQTRGEMAQSLYHSRWEKSSANNLIEKSPARSFKIAGRAG